METKVLVWLLYGGVNILLTLIWWTIPAWINMYRHKYNLPLRMVIWPLTPENFLADDLCKTEIALITMAGIVIASPALIIYLICKGTYTLGGGIINRIAFTKEEKRPRISVFSSKCLGERMGSNNFRVLMYCSSRIYLAVRDRW